MSATAHHPHRVARAVAAVRTELTSVAESSLWSMDATETTTTLHQLGAAKAQLAELEARILTHAHTLDVAGHTGATSTANWLAHRTATTSTQAHRTMRLAKALEAHAPTRTAMVEGPGAP